MEGDTICYLVTFILNTVIIIMDIFIIYCAVKTDEIRRHFVLQMIFLAMTMDIATYLTVVVHDLPSIIMDLEVSLSTPVMLAMVSIIFIQWFTQLFVLLTLSVIHAFAVFFPTQFRTFSSTHIQIAIITIVAINITLTVPILSPYCGYHYFIEGHYWSWDLSKPYTYLYVDCNLILQGLCAITVACVDISIIWRIRDIRVGLIAQAKVFTTTPMTQQKVAQGARISREMHLAVNFILLSACFLVMTTLFNVKIGGYVYGFLTNISYNLNLAKWSIYVLGNGTIRRKLLSVFRYQQADVTVSTF